MLTGAKKKQGNGECNLCHKHGTSYEITHWFIRKEAWCTNCFNYIERLRMFSGAGSIGAHFGLRGEEC